MVFIRFKNTRGAPKSACQADVDQEIGIQVSDRAHHLDIYSSTCKSAMSSPFVFVASSNPPLSAPNCLTLSSGMASFLQPF
jgi:hypothetical protein